VAIVVGTLAGVGLSCLVAIPLVVLFYAVKKRPSGLVGFLNICGVLTFVGTFSLLLAHMLKGC